MAKLYYCVECRKVEQASSKCGNCQSEKIKLLKVGTPVNVTGTKIKGKVFKIQEDEVKLLVINEAKEKLIKGYKYENLKKIL